ncbi:hypothetical protein P43SY_000024 [Pythium insidiosum]|uniref:Peptidase M24 domain-containing protein n=1 Tax=Pythium insidiosum TaxID=114742 RepID=A0AAD5LJ91_PYTIN|nr:hypothetical protein P43SY_000024 [Pythium insidiosum]
MAIASANPNAYVAAFAQDLAERRREFERKLAAMCVRNAFQYWAARCGLLLRWADVVSFSRQVLRDATLDGVVLSYAHNVAWLTNGARTFVNMAAEVGVGAIFVDQTRAVLLTNEIEGDRLLREEMRGLDDLITLHQDPWYGQPKALEVAQRLAGSEQVAQDTTHPIVEERLLSLRSTLSEHEMAIYRALGHDCGAIIGDVARAVRPGVTELEIAGQLAQRCWAKGIAPIVLLIAADERVDTHRHPLPTLNTVKHKAMLVLCGRRAGFVASVTRMVYVTTTEHHSIPGDLAARHDAATYVDAVAITSSRPGVEAQAVFKAIQDAYAAKGFPGEWKLHHQGGCAGYKSREWIATPEMRHKVAVNQAFAWNPSVTGTKSEDTVLLRQTPAGNTGYEVITATPGWPVIEHVVNGVSIQRPGILQLSL